MALQKWVEYLMNREKSLTPSEWVIQVIKDSKNDFMDVHFDVFRGYENPKGLSLLEYAYNILIEARASTELMASKQKYFKPFIYLPLGDSHTLSCWHNSNWKKLGEKNHEITYEPPSLYLLAKKELLFDNFSIEEYRCPIQLPSDFLLDKENKILSLFRCFRDQQSIENSWEFSTGVNLFYAGDFN